jgi:hypothetical protein
MKIKIDGYKCERCKHEWVKRGSKEPVVCPACKSPYWNQPKKGESHGGSTGSHGQETG